jgi:sec-independent protein translocase protein TatB
VIDITSSKLLILGLVALMVIGPKDLPALLRTLGKYIGIVKKHANDFRAQFDEAMRESELDQIKRDAEASMREAEEKIRNQMSEAQSGIDPNKILGGDPFADATPAPAATDPAATAVTPAIEASPAPAALEPAPAPAAVAEVVPAPAPAPVQTADAPRASEKTGA